MFRSARPLDTRFVATHKGYRTPRCSCLVTPDGERSFIGHWPDDMRMAPPSDEMLRGVGWLNLDMSGPLPMRLQAAQMAADRGIRVLSNDVYQPDDPILPLLDILVLSAAIIRTREPEGDPLRLAPRLQAAGDCDVIITDAAEEVTVLPRAGEPSRIRPPAVDAIDTTGAGDIFKSGLLYGLLQGLPLREAARWGAAAGSLMCQVAGVTQTLAPLDDVRRLLAAMD